MDYSITYKPRTAGQMVITLAQAKANARIDYSDEDELLQLYVDAVTNRIEEITGTIVLERNVAVAFPNFKHHLRIPVSPVQEVVSVTYKDANGDVQTVPTDNYTFVNGTLGNQIVSFKNFDFPNLEEDNAFPVTVEVKCGYLTQTVPADIKHAALLMFGAAESYREDMPVKTSTSAYAILKNHKRY
jgi:uncharacterized phiE125 gp8 family phage protein